MKIQKFKNPSGKIKKNPEVAFIESGKYNPTTGGRAPGGGMVLPEVTVTYQRSPVFNGVRAGGIVDNSRLAN